MKMFQPFALAVGICASLGACGSSKPLDVTVNWSDTRQTMDGFGASSAFFGQNLTDASADQLFDPKKGIGLSLLRTMIGVAGRHAGRRLRAVRRAADAHRAGADHGPAGHRAGHPGLGRRLDPTPDLEDDQQQVRIRHRTTPSPRTSWTPLTTRTSPATCGLRRHPGGGQPPVIGVSPANEPDYTATWDSAQWTADELTTFISQHMAPTFAQKYPT